MCCTIALHPRSRWCNGLAPLQQWPRYRQGPGFESHLRPVEVFTRNKVSPLNNLTTKLRLVSCAPINQLKTIKSTKRVQQFSVGRHTYTWQPKVAAKPMQNHLLLLLLSAAHCNLHPIGSRNVLSQQFLGSGHFRVAGKIDIRVGFLHRLNNT